MPKLELSIDIDFNRTGNYIDGITELIKNGLDAEATLNSELIVRYSKREGKLYITNPKVVLDRRNLLVGNSNKYGKDTIGNFGVGLPTACLLITRSNKNIIIRTGDEVWKPEISNSLVYEGTSVLKINIRDDSVYKNRTTVVILDITQEDWDSIKLKFLQFMRPIDKGRVYSQEQNSILFDRSGELFYKGALVASNIKELTWSYDLNEVELSMDGKVVDWAKINKHIQTLWNVAAKAGAIPDDIISKIIEENTEIDPSTTRYIHKLILKGFATNYPLNSVPIHDKNVSNVVKSIGLEPIVCKNERVRSVLEAWLGKTSKAVHQIIDRAGAISSLSIKQREVLDRLQEITQIIYPGLHIRPMHKNNSVALSAAGPSILLSHKLLSDFDEALKKVISAVACLKAQRMQISPDEAQIDFISTLLKTCEHGTNQSSREKAGI